MGRRQVTALYPAVGRAGRYVFNTSDGVSSTNRFTGWMASAPEQPPPKVSDAEKAPASLSREVEAQETVGNKKLKETCYGLKHKAVGVEIGRLPIAPPGVPGVQGSDPAVEKVTVRPAQQRKSGFSGPESAPSSKWTKILQVWKAARLMDYLAKRCLSHTSKNKNVKKLFKDRALSGIQMCFRNRFMSDWLPRDCIGNTLKAVHIRREDSALRVGHPSAHREAVSTSCRTAAGRLLYELPVETAEPYKPALAEPHGGGGKDACSGCHRPPRGACEEILIHWPLFPLAATSGALSLSVTA
ncbi:hypothetical protein H920_09497 [Fukomys damarensis]|uniref:Uncharacterized protein n=1 Tax=Fukomys damarensis TaxID=885580 RepID=A0A091DDI3_FUKDA|nr:hypothetical protein H920_09497 [Fukomys damarensis]